MPGSSGIAILLGARGMLGIQPGPMMAVNGLDLVWSLIRALAIYGPTFFLRPLSLVFIALIVGSAGFYIRRQTRPGRVEMTYDS